MEPPAWTRPCGWPFHVAYQALFMSTLRHSLRNPETQSNFHVWTEGKQTFLERIRTELFFSRYLMCWLFFVCPISHQIHRLPSLFFSMTCDMTPVNCITKTPSPWPSVWFVQWEALVGDLKAGGEREDGAFTTLLPFCLLVLHSCTSCQTAPLPPLQPCPSSGKSILSPNLTVCLASSLLLSPGYFTCSFMVPRNHAISSSRALCLLHW